MRRFSARAWAGGLVLLCVTPVLAGPLTVGDFLQEIARLRNLPARDAMTAASSLRAAGIDLGNLSLNGPLTEADAVRVGQAVGIRLKTQRPQATFERGQLTALVTALAPNAPGDKPVDPNRPPRSDPQPGKGKSKGFYKSPIEPGL